MNQQQFFDKLITLLRRKVSDQVTVKGISKLRKELNNPKLADVEFGSHVTVRAIKNFTEDRLEQERYVTVDYTAPDGDPMALFDNGKPFTDVTNGISNVTFNINEGDPTYTPDKTHSYGMVDVAEFMLK